jgi:hypothetical protein
MGKEKTVEKSSTKDNKKSSKDDKKGKESKKHEEEKPVKKVNRNTDKAQLHFDVNPRKSWTKEYVDRMKYTIVKTDKETKKKSDAPPMLSGIQFALTVADQVTCDALVNACVGMAKPTTEGLYQLTSELISTAVKVTPELNLIFGHHLGGYHVGTNYFKSLGMANGTKAVKAGKDKDGNETKERPATNDELTDFVEQCVNGGGNTKVSLSDDGKNFLCYLLDHVRTTLTDSAVRKVQYSNKKGLDIRSVAFSVKDHFSGAKNFSKTLCAKMEEVEGLVDEANKEERTKKPAKKESETKDSKSKDAKSKGKKEESKAKSSSKNAKKEEPESESESESEAETESDSDSDSGSDEE